MTKFQIPNNNQFSIFKKLKLFGAWCLVIGICLVFGAWCLVIPARSQSPEASPTAGEAIEEKVQDIREAVKEKVREKLAEVQEGQKKAFAGEVKEIAHLTLTLQDHQGKKQVRLADEATIIDQKRQEIELEDLAIGNYVIAMGYLENSDLLEAKRIVITEEPEPLGREIVFGRVTDISEEKVLTVKNEKKGITYTLETTAKTKITTKKEGKIENVKFSQIAVGDQLVAIGAPAENEEKIITAKLIHVIPDLSSPTPSPKATPSPEVTP